MGITNKYQQVPTSTGRAADSLISTFAYTAGDFLQQKYGWLPLGRSTCCTWGFESPVDISSSEAQDIELNELQAFRADYMKFRAGQAGVPGSSDSWMVLNSSPGWFSQMCRLLIAVVVVVFSPFFLSLKCWFLRSLLSFLLCLLLLSWLLPYDCQVTITVGTDKKQ